MNKKLLISLSIIGVVAAVATGVTIALFNDTETSTGNIFTAGTIDLKVDHILATYNGEPCVGDCVETGAQLIVNGGFETPDVPTGSWAIYPNASLTFWNVESGAGLEIQDHAAGNPHDGNQLAELDSNNPSSISQNIATVAGKEYRLTLWYSPRPYRPAGDNTIGAIVKVTSGTVEVINDVIGANSAGGSNTIWTQYTYSFVATDASTKIMFSDLGTANSYGGYLDDISVRALDCTKHFPTGGVCTLWNERDLGAGDVFWNFDDVKPGDRGTNVISLHVASNDAYICMLTNHKQNLENGLVDPEIALGDTDAQGELSQYLNLVVWEDKNANGIYEPGTEGLLYNGVFDNLPTIGRLPLAGNGFDNLGIAWCLGTQTVAGDGIISCSGSGNQDIAQTDKLLADLVLYAVQQRNNSSFTCASVILPQ
jgi:predicted ribosomally synthesized peptide with SipW-like signal peptide